MSNPPSNSRTVVIAVQNLIKEYRVGRQKVYAINDVSLEIYKGEFVALTGASGSGKSTLLQLIGGLDRPSSGSVLIDNQQLSELSDRKLSAFRNKTIGFVFQFFYLQPFLTLERNIEVAAMPNRMKKLARKERINYLAKRVGLLERLGHLPKELSGGQIQRAAIARALLNQPSIILADEPTGNLDSQNSHEILELFKSLRDEFGATIVIATHDQAIAVQADRVISIQDGGIA
ncbi:ABC transporter ATP-binding protein [Candidatus Saccharibacteria bacterium]|nr:ABC transporter ATP-binding protein [Candidatus Saccharibacteria bacterium]